MKPAACLLVLLPLLGLAGCVSVASQKRLFLDLHNGAIGRPFYAYEMQGMKEVKLSASLSEFVPETVPGDRAVVAWMVDTSSRGPYLHRNGMTFQIEGMKKSWRLLGDPELARTKTDWWGPW